MNRRVHPTAAARTDLLEQAAYLAEQDGAAAGRFLDAVEATLELLLLNPELGAVYQLRNPRLHGLRVWRVKGFEKYLIFYQSGAAALEVIRILHGARDIQGVLDAE